MDETWIVKLSPALAALAGVCPDFYTEEMIAEFDEQDRASADQR